MLNILKILCIFSLFILCKTAINKIIGTKARMDIEPFLQKNVYLELFVKVIPKWRDREKFLNETMYKEFNFDNK